MAFEKESCLIVALVLSFAAPCLSQGPTLFQFDANSGRNCSDPLVESIVSLHNDYRTNGQLECSNPASFVAGNVALGMCSLGTIKIPSLFETLSASGFRGGGVNVNSNTGALPETATLAFEAWTNIASSEEIVTADFEEIGCGWTVCNDDKLTYWACVYGTPGEDPSEISTPPPPSSSVESMFPAEAAVSPSTVSDEDLAPSMVEDSKSDGAMVDAATEGIVRRSCDDSMVAELVDRINAFRAENGTEINSNALVCSDLASENSKAWSSEMCTIGRLKLNPVSDVLRSGFNSGAQIVQRLTEPSTVKEAFIEFREDSSFTILSENEQIGCGWHACESEDSISTYWTCLFGTP